MYNKCVIVFNKELIAGIQKGKLCTQAAHCLTELTLKYANVYARYNFPNNYVLADPSDFNIGSIPVDECGKLSILFQDWRDFDKQIKITLQCPTTEEFEALYKKMCENFYYCKGVIDAGLTGNHGQAMWCFACIGEVEKIDEFTKELSLL